MTAKQGKASRVHGKLKRKQAEGKQGEGEQAEGEQAEGKSRLFRLGSNPSQKG